MPRALRAIPAAPDLIPGTDIPAAPAFVALLAAEAAAPGLRKGERTRRAVRLATARMLERTPVAGLSMDLISAEAGVSRPALYQYFSAKEDAVRDVLEEFQSRTLEIPREATLGATIRERIRRTNRYYIDYVAKNAVFMERIREARDVLPDLLAARQRVNAAWARRVAQHVQAHGRLKLAEAALQLRILALECMIDDVLREIYVIGNPGFDGARQDPDRLAEELTAIWDMALYGGTEAPPG